jgi:hypothetical protein
LPLFFEKLGRICSQFCSQYFADKHWQTQIKPDTKSSETG